MTEEKMKICDDIITDLQGTCDNNLAELLVENGLQADDQEALDYINEEIFLCADCGWWCESYERNDKNDESICDDCNRSIWDEESDDEY